jgi:hypothetical protein
MFRKKWCTGRSSRLLIGEIHCHPLRRTASRHDFIARIKIGKVSKSDRIGHAAGRNSSAVDGVNVIGHLLQNYA